MADEIKTDPVTGQQIPVAVEERAEAGGFVIKPRVGPFVIFRAASGVFRAINTETGEIVNPELRAGAREFFPILGPDLSPEIQEEIRRNTGQTRDLTSELGIERVSGVGGSSGRIQTFRGASRIPTVPGIDFRVSPGAEAAREVIAARTPSATLTEAARGQVLPGRGIAGVTARQAVQAAGIAARRQTLTEPEEKRLTPEQRIELFQAPLTQEERFTGLGNVLFAKEPRAVRPVLAGIKGQEQLVTVAGRPQPVPRPRVQIEGDLLPETPLQAALMQPTPTNTTTQLALAAGITSTLQQPTTEQPGREPTTEELRRELSTIRAAPSEAIQTGQPSSIFDFERRLAGQAQSGLQRFQESPSAVERVSGAAQLVVANAAIAAVGLALLPARGFQAAKQLFTRPKETVNAVVQSGLDFAKSPVETIGTIIRETPGGPAGFAVQALVGAKLTGVAARAGARAAGTARQAVLKGVAPLIAEEIQAEKIVAKEALKPVPRFPLVTPRETPSATIQQAIKEFRQAPKETFVTKEGVLRQRPVLTAAESPVSGRLIGAGERPGEAPGLFVSPQERGASARFLRLGIEQKEAGLLSALTGEAKLRLFPRIPKPTITQLGVTEVERLPPSIRTQPIKKIREFLTTQAEKGKAFLTPKLEKGIATKTSVEVEATIVPGTKLLREKLPTVAQKIAGFKQFTRVAGQVVPVQRIATLREQISAAKPLSLSTVLEEFDQQRLVSQLSPAKPEISIGPLLSQPSIIRRTGKSIVQQGQEQKPTEEKPLSLQQKARQISISFADVLRRQIKKPLSPSQPKPSGTGLKPVFIPSKKPAPSTQPRPAPSGFPTPSRLSPFKPITSTGRPMTSIVKPSPALLSGLFKPSRAIPERFLSTFITSPDRRRLKEPLLAQQLKAKKAKFKPQQRRFAPSLEAIILGQRGKRPLGVRVGRKGKRLLTGFEQRLLPKGTGGSRRNLIINLGLKGTFGKSKTRLF